MADLIRNAVDVCQEPNPERVLPCRNPRARRASRASRVPRSLLFGRRGRATDLFRVPLIAKFLGTLSIPTLSPVFKITDKATDRPCR